MENTITWLPMQDNIIEGKVGNAKLYIFTKVVSKEPVVREVQSLYLVSPEKKDKTILSNKWSIDEVKEIAKDLYGGSLSIKD